MMESPGLGKVNGRSKMMARGGRREIGTSDEYKAFKTETEIAARNVMGIRRPIAWGAVSVAITFWWPRRNRKLAGVPQPWPMGDVDATIKAVLDGLQAGGVFDSDARVGEVHARKRYDKEYPRVVIGVKVIGD